MLRYFNESANQIELVQCIIGCPAHRLCDIQGLSVFTKVLEWFQNQNNWAGWGIFLAMYTANVSLLLPGIVLILGAGFIFGFASVLFWHAHRHCEA